MVFKVIKLNAKWKSNESSLGDKKIRQITELSICINIRFFCSAFHQSRSFSSFPFWHLIVCHKAGLKYWSSVIMSLKIIMNIGGFCVTNEFLEFILLQLHLLGVEMRIVFNIVILWAIPGVNESPSFCLILKSTKEVFSLRWWNATVRAKRKRNPSPKI